MGDLRGRMYAGIGAAGATQRDLVAAEFCHRLLDGGLHRMQAGLPLPTGIGATVIFDVQAIARHVA